MNTKKRKIVCAVLISVWVFNLCGCVKKVDEAEFAGLDSIEAETIAEELGEVEAVASYVKENYNADYSQEVLEEIERKAQQTGKKPASVDVEPNQEELDGDEMLPAAVDVILETGQASVSMLQRRLKLGYARAARIVDEMEEKGIVGPFQGSKPRAILVTKEQWASMRSGQSRQLGFEDMGEDFSAVPDAID